MLLATNKYIHTRVVFFAYEKSTKKCLKILFGKTSTLRRAFALKKNSLLTGCYAELKTKKRVCLVLTNMLETGGNFNADILFLFILVQLSTGFT